MNAHVSPLPLVTIVSERSIRGVRNILQSAAYDVTCTLIKKATYFFLREPISVRNKRACGYDFSIYNNGLLKSKTKSK